LTLRGARFSALAAVAVCALAGCAGDRLRGVERPAAEVRVYEPELLQPGQYEVVRYLWVDTWRAAFWLPSHSSKAEGIASLQAEAGRLGANGLINVGCQDQGPSIWSWSQKPAILCSGSAIRVH
jgi:hypothetical protein